MAETAAASNASTGGVPIHPYLEVARDSGEYEVLAQSVRAIKGVPGLTVEIGVRAGGGSYLIMKELLANDDAREAHVGIDPYGNIEYRHWEDRVERLDYTNAMKAKALANLYAWSHVAGYNYAHFTLEDTEFFSRYPDGVPIYDEAKTVVNQYALVFFDGPHSVEDVRTEYEFFAPRTPVGAYWVFDDVDQYAHMTECDPEITALGFEATFVGRRKAAYVRVAIPEAAQAVG